MFQTMSPPDAAVHLGLGTAARWTSPAARSGSFAWTIRLAQQSLQSDFDPNLVRMFDKYAHGWVGQRWWRGRGVSVSVDGASARAIQGLLTSDFGFADFVTAQRRGARGAAGGGGRDGGRRQRRSRHRAPAPERREQPPALLLQGRRPRRHGRRQQPGEAGYAALAAARAYQLSKGGTEINGPGTATTSQTGCSRSMPATSSP